LVKQLRSENDKLTLELEERNGELIELKIKLKYYVENEKVMEKENMVCKKYLFFLSDTKTSEYQIFKTVEMFGYSPIIRNAFVNNSVFIWHFGALSTVRCFGSFLELGISVFWYCGNIPV